MLHSLIAPQVHAYFARPDCPVASLVAYIQKRGFLREAQIEAIKTYLFLKIEGGNRPLHELFCQGFFTRRQNLDDLPLSQNARQELEQNVAARSLWEFASRRAPGSPKSAFPELENYLRGQIQTVDCEGVSRRFFAGVTYSDYLFSLPMGAGKTYLMAALMLLDLHFALQEPDNPVWAHNFLILVPSGLKSSILPSLKTIEKFDASWVLPEPAASQVKNLLRFELLDQPKTAAKSNKARNPNAQKVGSHQPFEDLLGLVLVVNAEKVILDRVNLTQQGELFETSDDEKDKAANELRNLIGKIPNLQILIDEVHHAATDDIKLRRVVGKWSAGGNVNGVLGFSGTPYLSKPENIAVGNGASVKFAQITNTVFYYPLVTAIQAFLKKPTVRALHGLEPLAIVGRGVAEFETEFGNTIYPNGTRAKLAIYCGSIERLETEVFPFLVGEMGISPGEILRYHKGNKAHPTPAGAQLEFESLDTSLSSQRFVLLVQIGKEGWDCKSLAGVILSQKGDCPSNMVLQTSCRCLRQVARGAHEKAGIWLNADNAKVLDKQLGEEQNTSIAQINALGEATAPLLRPRFSRLEVLHLPTVDFFQLQVETDTLFQAQAPAPAASIGAIEAANWRSEALIVQRGLLPGDAKKQTIVLSQRGEVAAFSRWLLGVHKGGFGGVSLAELKKHAEVLRPIFEAITVVDDATQTRHFNTLFDLEALNSQVRLAFHHKRELRTRTEAIEQSARLLLVEKLAPVAASKTLFPDQNEVESILKMDESGQTSADWVFQKRAEREKAMELLQSQGFGHMQLPEIAPPTLAIAHRDHSLHFLPYDFSQSKFELEFLREALTLSDLETAGLQLYYNGENHLTEFRIVCHEKKGDHWARVGLYTPDFLLIRRVNGDPQGPIDRVLIIETKGSGFGEQSTFQKRRQFIEGQWLRLNEEKFGYQRFDYLYLSDGDAMSTNLHKLSAAIGAFFGG